MLPTDTTRSSVHALAGTVLPGETRKPGDEWQKYPLQVGVLEQFVGMVLAS